MRWIRPVAALFAAWLALPALHAFEEQLREG